MGNYFIFFLDSDARYTSYETARMTGFLEASTRTILKKKLGLTRKVARWIPNILTNKQNAARLKMAQNLLKMYPKFDKKNRKYSDRR